MMRNLDVRPARWADLPALTSVFGQEEFYVDRLERQDDKLGMLLTAWSDGGLVGVTYLWTEPAEEPEIRQHLPGVPLITHVEIDAGHRGRGAGGLLIRAAEDQLVAIGHDHVALAVNVENVRAARLYERLGYVEWPHSVVLCRPFFETHNALERCRVMVRALQQET